MYQQQELTNIDVAPEERSSFPLPFMVPALPGEYAPPAGYLVNEKEAEAFDREFPYMEKKKLPGQIF